MKETIQHPVYGEILYEENIWTSKKSITINGAVLQEKSKKEFEMSDGKIATIKGGIYQGVSLVIDGETIMITPKMKWYEIVLSLFPFVLILIWGNSEALCKIFPVVGGLIGGAISGFISAVGSMMIRVTKSLWLKILIGFLSTCVTVLICWLVACAIISILA